jgi:hypothetical protein
MSSRRSDRSPSGMTEVWPEYDIGEHYASEIAATLKGRCGLEWCQDNEINVAALFASLRRAIVKAATGMLFGTSETAAWQRRAGMIAMVIAERRVDEMTHAAMPEATLGARQQQALTVKELLHTGGGVRLIEQLPPPLLLVGAPMLDRMALRGELLAIPWLEFRDFLFPVAQFASDGSHAPGLRRVRDCLQDVPFHAQLAFLLAPLADNEVRTPLQLLHAGELRRVLKAADQQVALWAT